MTLKALVNDMIKGDRKALAQAITLVESTHPKQQDQREQLMAYLPNPKKTSLRIGITGIPGVGKSTFINQLGQLILTDNQKIQLGILTIDPSSPVAGGSILGDKTRMHELANYEQVFIRPSPSDQLSGGLAPRTREAVLLLEAAGFDLILIESVGVGQAEDDIAYLVDTLLLLIMPATGDDLQGLKKGLIELADFILINKSDNDLEKSALRTKSILAHTLSQHTYLKTISSLYQKGLAEIWQKLNNLRQNPVHQKRLAEKRHTQVMHWLKKEVFFQVHHTLMTSRHAKQQLIEHMLPNYS